QPAPLSFLPPSFQLLLPQRLPPDHQRPRSPFPPFCHPLRQPLHMPRRQLHQLLSSSPHRFGQPPHPLPSLPPPHHPPHHHLPPHPEGHTQSPPLQVEPDRGAPPSAGLRPLPVRSPPPLQVVTHPPMCHHYPLRPPRRSRRVDHIGRMLPSHLHSGVAA